MAEVDAKAQALNALYLSKKMKRFVQHDFSQFTEDDFVDDGLDLGELSDGTPEPNTFEYKKQAYSIKRHPAGAIRMVTRLTSLEHDLIRVRTRDARFEVVEFDLTINFLKELIFTMAHPSDLYELGEYEKLLAEIMGPVLPYPFDREGKLFGLWALKKDTDGRANYEKLNDAVRFLTATVKSSAFKKKLAQRKQKSEERRRSISELFAYLFDRHSRLLICRIDFHFKKREAPNITPAECSKLFAKLTKGIKDRSELAKGHLGYAAVLEINRARHYHIHAFMIYNGAVRDNPRFMCDQLGEYWKKVTNGVGYSHDCSLTWRKQYHKAIGVIDYTDDYRLSELFEVAIPYLCKGDEYFRVIAKGSRTFWRSEISADKQRKFASKPGPKRSKETAPKLLAVKADH